MLEEGCIRFCDWNEHGGSLEYDISSIHPDWDVVIQTYEVSGVSFDGQLIYASNFSLYARGSNVPTYFSLYPSDKKRKLWEVIFAIKRKFFAEVKPDIVEHFIKAPYQVSTRLALYEQHLDLLDYTIEQTTHTFTLIRRR